MSEPNNSSRRGMGWIIALVAVCAALLGIFARHQLSSPVTDQATALMAITLVDIQDQPQPMAQWQGKPLIVNFWATWCPPCREEMPLFDRTARDYAARGVQFVGISIDDVKAAKDYGLANPTSYPLLLGSMDILGLTQSLGNSASALPFTVLVSRSGRIHQVKLGPYKDEELAMAVEDLLTQP